MGIRTITGFTDTGSNSEYYKIISDLEARVRIVTEDGGDLSLGSGIGALSAGEFYMDYENDKLYVRATDSGDPNNKVMKVVTYFLVWGAWGTQTEMNTNLEIFQKITPSKAQYVRYIKIHIMKFGNPTFTDLKLEIHPELNNYPTKKVLATPENTWTNTTVSSDQNSLTEIWFRYDDYGIKDTESYCLVLKATGTFTSSSHVSWAKLDPIHTSGLTLDTNLIGEGPYRYGLVGRDA